jgi:aspartate aminotransferase
MNVKSILSSVFSNLTPSSTLYINETVNKRWQRGEQVFHMGFGESRFDVHPKLQQALTNNVHRKSYLPSKGLPELCSAVAEYYSTKLKQEFKPKQVIIGPGSKSLIFSLQMALEADLFLPAPSWVSYEPQARLLNLKAAYIPATAESGYAFDLGAFDKLVKTSDNPSKLLVINSPNNPTGQMLTAEFLEALANYCREQNILVLSDEIYFQVVHGNQQHVSISKYYPEGSFVLGGLSKHLSIGGWRLGLAILPDNEIGEQLIPALQVIASETWSSVPAPIQYAALIAYSNDADLEKYIADCAKIHGIRTRHIYDHLVSLGILCTKPIGAFYITANFDRWKAELKGKGITTSKQLANHLLEHFAIASLPTDAFGVTETELSLRLATSYLDFETDTDASRLYDLYCTDISAESYMSIEHHPNTAAALAAFEQFTTGLS